MAAAPNILYIHSHDTGRFIQPYGHAVSTPNLQKLAEQGVLFRHAFATAATCSPSRAGLLTGQHPHQCGMLGLAHGGWSLHDPSQHLAAHLREAGYHTALAGIQHETHDYHATAYERLLCDIAWPNMWQQADERAADFLRDEAPQLDRPFFLAVGFFETHRFLDDKSAGSHAWGTRRGDPRYVQPPAIYPDTPEMRADWADYVDAAAVLDRRVGRVLDALEASGLADNTLVIATTDHGIAFPHCKCNLFDSGLGVYLMMRGPVQDGTFRGGRVIDEMVSHLDVYPTVCEAAGIEAPDGLEGRSLQPLMRGEVEHLHDAVFGEETYHGPYVPQRSVRTPRYKYIRHFAVDERKPSTCCNPGPTKHRWLDDGWDEQPMAAEQLYDLTFDPTERNNIAERPDMQAVLADMRGRLENWMRRTDDPLLAGPVPRPAGNR